MTKHSKKSLRSKKSNKQVFSLCLKIVSRWRWLVRLSNGNSGSNRRTVQISDRRTVQITALQNP